MVDKNELRAGFSSRLHVALNDAGIRTRGRGVDIHRQLKSMGIYKTTQAISKWLNGESMAEADSMTALSSWLAVRREWLEYGVLPKQNTRNSEPDTAIGSNIEIKPIIGKVPLLTWEQARAWCRDNADAGLTGSETWLSCPVSISKRGYALEVVGDSMTNPGQGRSYPPGCIIFVDPASRFNTGDRVIARVPRTNDVTFKILVEDAGRQFLRPINPQYPILDITGEMHICGTVIGAFIPE